MNPQNIKPIFAIVLLFTGIIACAAQGTYTVLTTDDDGPGSLRQTILDASPGSIIGFALPAGSVITLTSGELVIDKDLQIIGQSDAADLVIMRVDAAETAFFRIFHIKGSSNVTLERITVTGGMPDDFDMMGSGAGILIESGCTLTANYLAVVGNNPVHGGGGPSEVEFITRALCL